MSDEPSSPAPVTPHFDPSSPRLGKKRGGAEALLLVFGVTLAAIPLEGLARMAEHGQLQKGGYSPVRGHRSREPMNTAGYRDVEHSKDKPPGVHRAMFVGDSFTYGAGVLLDDTYAKRTERSLSSTRSEKWESIVLAVPGIDTEQEATIVQNEAFAYSPDVVVLGYVLNDAEDPDAAEHRRAAAWTETESAKRNPPWWSHSALLRLITSRIHATRENSQRIENHLSLYRDNAAGFQAVKKSLAEIAALCREKHVPLVVLLFPLFANPLDDQYPFSSIHEKMAALAHTEGLNLVDLLPYYRGMDWHLLVVEGARDEHPNELAHRIAAQALLAALETALPAAPIGSPPPGSNKR